MPEGGEGDSHPGRDNSLYFCSHPRGRQDDAQARHLLHGCEGTLAEVPKGHQVQQHILESSREAAQGGCQGKEMGHCLQQPGRKLPQMEHLLQKGLLQGLQKKWGPVGPGALGKEVLEQS